VKRRVEPDIPPTPPAELTDYPAWCRERGLAPFGHTADLVSMRAAVSQWKVWEQLRTEWAQAHGVDEGDLGGADSAPFDIDAI
jgi:hypothetical protein